MLLGWKAHGKTILIAEHRLYFLRDIADRIIYMEKGRIKHTFTGNEFEALGAKALNDMGLRSLSLDHLKTARCDHPVGLQDDLELSDMSFCHKKDCPILDLKGLHISSGDCVAVIGHNGAGKTTFARCLCGLERKCKGTVLRGKKAMCPKERLKRCFMIMQDVNHQLFTESVLDEVLLSMSEKNEETADDILKSLGLSDMRELHPMALSGGEKQRVAIASALASNRDILIFDEPTSGLDLRHMHEVAANIEKLTVLGKTIFVITHDPEFILSCCTYVVHMEEGQISETYRMDESGIKHMIAFFQCTEGALMYGG
jgi:energy-coupling factor transport system ATP-binding protein